MTRREFSAGAAGPVELDLTNLVRNGNVHVRVRADQEMAQVVLLSADSTGPSHIAVETAELNWDAAERRLSVEVQAQPGAGVIDPRLGSTMEIWADVPPLSKVAAHTGNANVETHGQLADVHVDSTSGEVMIDSAKSVFVRTSAPVRVGSADEVVVRADGAFKADPVTIGQAHNATVTNDRGDVRIGKVDGVVTVKTEHGAIQVDDIRDGTANLRSANGPIELTVSDAKAVRATSMNSRVDATVRDTARGDLDIQVSGTQTVTRAQPGHGDASRAGAGERPVTGSRAGSKRSNQLGR